jgi:arginyl-tRNA synthetase
MSYKLKIQEEIKKAVSELFGKDNELPQASIERTKTKEHGDVATNIAMILSKPQKRNPIDIAEDIKKNLKIDSGLISHIEIAKPGFINIVIGDFALAESLIEICGRSTSFGFSSPNSKEKILVEFVSANPTGDMHIGHGRQAALGSSLVNLLKANGYEVSSEFYINDYGEQIQKLSDTSWAIYKKLNNETFEWKEDFYPEDIIFPFVKKSIEKKSSFTSKEELGNLVKDLILKSQKELLEKCNVKFDRWFSETDLHTNKKTEDILSKLKEKNYTYESEGALWLKSKDMGDVRDRVLIRSDKRPTYLVADIAYHIDKFSRSKNLITIWGADHHGQEVSLKGGLKALGYDEKKLEIVFVQLVSLKKDGQEYKMSKRAGTFVTIEELLNEVGVDAFRYFMIESHSDNRMIFDIDLARKQDKDNPVYYIQYAHARCSSIFRQIGETDLKVSIEELLNQLNKDPNIFMNLFKANNQEYTATKSLILKILDFPDEVTNAARNRAPNRIANYLKELATDLHVFYTNCRVISQNNDLTKARLGLIYATKITISNGLKILGITAPESM